METCKICGKSFDPALPPREPAEEAGAILAREQYGDAGQVCLVCLGNRGRLAMMYGPQGRG
ncbi:MAG: hypothetical protein WDA20_14065 [Desulfuromonadales bacterium]